ncbi:MAG: nitroreductase/quinone reductase family protein [Roseiflexaceae bacterium]
MTQTSTPRRRPPDFMYKIINPTFKLLLRTPLHGLMSERLLLLSFTGRSSGKRYTIPVAYAQQGDTLLIATQSRWWKNLRDGAAVQVRLRGRNRNGTSEVITDEAGLTAAYRLLLPQGPQLSEIIGVTLDANGEPRPEEVRRSRENGFVVVRVQLQPER